MSTAAPFDRGIVTISLDTELGWARINSSRYDDIEARLNQGKQAIIKLLSLFEDYDIPAMWAVVGQLCREDPGQSPETNGVQVMPEDANVPWDRDWWHAPDYIRRIVSSEIDHEIGSHSGNHLRFDCCERRQARWDLEAFRDWVYPLSTDPATSFVFPQNSPGHFAALSEAGFRCYRGRPPVLGSGPSPTAFLPRLQDGLVNVPVSVSYRHYGGRGPVMRRLPLAVKVAGMKLGVVRAARNRRVFHLALHPNDFTLADGRRLLDGLERWLQFVARQRQRGSIRVMTMSEIADRARFTR